MYTTLHMQYISDIYFPTESCIHVAGRGGGTRYVEVYRDGRHKKAYFERDVTLWKSLHFAYFSKKHLKSLHFWHFTL